MKLDDLRLSRPGITPAFGGCLCEAASICLEDRAHQSGVLMKVTGALSSHSLQLTWSPITQQGRNCYADLQFATELGAYGIAVLLIECFTELTVFERSRKGTGFDYWLAPKGFSQPLFQDKIRLEVSGILKGEEADMKRRMRQKLMQLERGGVALPGYGFVVHFAPPESRVAMP